MVTKEIPQSNRDSRGYFIKGHKTNIGRVVSEETRKRLSKPRKSNLAWIGKKLSEETKRKIGLTKIGNTYSLGKKLTPEQCKNRSEVAKKDGRKPPSQVGLKRRPESIERTRIANSGERSPMWKGGYKVLRKRNCAESTRWRKQIFERDNYTCVWCGQRGGELNADHIMPWSTHEELRFELSNGRTLCKKCHIKTETYGRQKRNN